MPLDVSPKDFVPLPALDPPGGAPAAVFNEAKFLEPEIARAEWTRLGDLLPALPPIRTHLGELWQALQCAADPDLALRQLVRLLDGIIAAADSGDGSLLESFGKRWLESGPFRESLTLLLGVSPALGEDLLAEWPVLRPESWRAAWESRASIERRLLRASEAEPARPGSESSFLEALKRFRRVEAIRIAFLDECVRLPVEQITRQVSWLADATTECCLRHALGLVGRRFGVEPPRGGFTVLALGKLGGLELNYSSDIDLNFLMDDSPEPAGREPDSWQAKIHEPAVFFTRVAEKLIDLLTSFDGGPPLYRVDTRLRPEGSSGRLVWTLAASLEYYHAVGRTWERQALIRARPIAGDGDLGRRFLEGIEPFIFRKLLTEESLGDLQNLKAQIEALANSRGEAETHVKIGHGGIRDVEYIVQYLQLLHGAEAPELRRANTFEALEQLQRRGILESAEVDNLGMGYRLLRQVENRIQLNYRLQSHTLPKDPRDLRRIARGLGCSSVAEFGARFAEAQRRIRSVYRRLFQGAASIERQEAQISAILELPFDLVKEQGARFLAPYGFKQPEAAFEMLRRMAGAGAALWDQMQAEDAFRKVALKLLREVSQFPDPDRTLFNLCEAVNTLGARSVFFDLLRESDDAMRKVVELCGHSSYLIEILRGYPGLFDEAIDALRTGHPIELDALKREAEHLADQAAKHEDGGLRLFQDFKMLNFLTIALRDVERRQNLAACMRMIAQTAEAVIHGALRIAVRRCEERLGSPPLPAGEAAPRLLVLALGKLGGEEMNYRSDLDLVFLYAGAGETSRGFTVQEYYTQVAQELFAYLNRMGPLGRLWESDARLRPMGSKNLLAISIEAWESYFLQGSAQTWERQASLRGRAVAGDERLAKRVDAFIRTRIPLAPDEDPALICREIHDMRRRLEASVPRGDLKRGEGGIMDVEFLVQTLQLVHGRRLPELIVPNTAAGILIALKKGLLDELAGSELLSAYQFLRWLETRFSLLLAPEESIQKLDQERLRSMIQRIGYRSSGAEAPESIFLDELRYHLARNRSHFLRILNECSAGAR